VTGTDPGHEGTVSWRELLAETTARLAAGGADNPPAEARWMVEEASGEEGAELLLALDRPATVRGVAHLDALVGRRLAGEPVQYVLGHWSFRRLDLLCDRRALIPRPETEQVVEAALAALDHALLGRPDGHRPVAVDLGTGTGAIALSIAVERPGAEVWGVDASPDAVAVARANLAGLGMAGGRVRLAEGSWFEPLPDHLRGGVDLVVTNPPYVAGHEVLPPEVARWEPADALVPGPTGLEAYDAIIAWLPEWLAPGGAFVAEIGFDQAGEVVERCRAAGLVDVAVEPDLAGLDRAVVARAPGAGASRP
jgi:release factor glutamine methyltransferase